MEKYLYIILNKFFKINKYKHKKFYFIKNNNNKNYSMKINLKQQNKCYN